ncbi:MAG: RnfABCDGE type electron transport complex subunit B, partial [Gammaproteobacteria bacterium]|nr:RnfABCDGE type electron transport complex subunit B [Gammaproteobacteria bacterium]
EQTIEDLANLLDVEVLEPAQEDQSLTPTVAVIDEETCIGCTLCIQACPIDAILGASKLMHTVIASECTGCDLCLPPCPVDCIEMVPVKTKLNTWQWNAPENHVNKSYQLVDIKPLNSPH